MGTKTVDEAGTTEAAEVKPEDQAAAAAEAGAAEETEEATAEADLVENGSESGEEGPSGVGQGAGAVVSAALGFVSLSGSWVGTIASARQELKGQLESQTSSSASVAKLLDTGYYQAWHATALWAGLFALLGLIAGVVVLVRPAFGAPGKPQAAWIKSVAWGGVALGVLGLLLAVLKYTDVLLGSVSAG
ncbi:hypothetical protein [Streptomyces sp. NPDC057403]|uniref:hypothetical protein n=1 Tax=Streptomyces sp. NPDC057403 TaxID=3346119 RepID=UPI0036D03FB2